MLRDVLYISVKHHLGCIFKSPVSYEPFGWSWSPAKVFLRRAPSSPLTLAANPKSVTFTRPS